MKDFLEDPLNLVNSSNDENDTVVPEPSSTKVKTIVMAEDDPFVSRMYNTKLSSAGYNVIVCNNGRDAYDTIKKVLPDLLIIDINMPEVMGLDLVKMLISDGFNFKAHPAIILTNSSSKQDLQTAKELNLDYLIKAELTPREVLEKIQAKIGNP